MSKIDKIAIELIKESKAVIESGKDLKKNGFSFSALKKISREVCIVVETYTKEAGIMSSKAKVELAVAVINLQVDIPFVPEWLETKIFKYIVGKVVTYLNKKFGSDWLDKVTKLAK